MEITYAATVAGRVASAITSSGQTQVWLSEATGIPRTTLIRRLAGHAPFTLAEIDSIADALGLDVGDLVRAAA